MRAIRNREIVVRLYVDDEGGTLLNATGTPTVSVKDGSGTTVTGVSAVTNDGVGVYKATIPPRPQLDNLVVTWTAVVNTFTREVIEEVKVVSDRLVPLWRLREDAELATLSTLNMLRCASAVEDWFADALGYPPVEESHRSTFNHPGGARLRVPGVWYPKTAISMTQGDTALDATDLAELRVVDGAFEFKNSGAFDVILGTGQQVWAQGRKTVWITHGPPEDWKGVPEDLVRAAAVLARYVARESNYPERARSVTTEHAIISFSTPNHDRPTGLPEVDGAVNRYGVKSYF